MLKILFVCHGNICRSPMAEFIMKEKVRQRGLESEISVSSAATSREALGEDVHPETVRQLRAHSVPYSSRRAVQVKSGDYDEYNLIVVMDKNNLRNIRRFFPDDPEGKICLLGEFGDIGEIDDPWYTGDFARTYDEISSSCDGLSDYLAGFCGGGEPWEDF